MHGTIKALAPTVAEPSLEHFAIWLEREVARRGAETEYIYVLCDQCLNGLYADSRGDKYDARRFWTALTNPKSTAGQIEAIGREWPRTLGAALQRTRTALAEREG